MEKIQFNSSKVNLLFYYDVNADSYIPVSSLNPLPVQTKALVGVDKSIYNETLNVNANDVTKVIDYIVPASSIFF